MNTQSNVFLGIVMLVIGFGLGYLLKNNDKAPGENTLTMDSVMQDMMSGLLGKTGDDFDKAFIREMIVHHRGAIAMAQIAKTNAKHQEIKILADAIISAQTGEIVKMEGWLKAWYNEEPGPVTSGENPQPGGIHDMPIEPAATQARKDLAVKIGVSEKSIVILQITEATWNDGCLGLGGPAESCLQALVPGFKVEMLAKGKTYFYRTNKTGATVRAEIQ